MSHSSKPDGPRTSQETIPLMMTMAMIVNMAGMPPLAHHKGRPFVACYGNISMRSIMTWNAVSSAPPPKAAPRTTTVLAALAAWS